MPRNFLYNVFYLSSYKSWLYGQVDRQRNAIKKGIGFIYSPIGLILDGDKLLNEIKIIVVKIKYKNDMGKKDFHPRFIS